MTDAQRIERIKRNLEECRNILEVELPMAMDEEFYVLNSSLPSHLQGKANADKLGKSPTLRIVKQRHNRHLASK